MTHTGFPSCSIRTKNPKRLCSFLGPRWENAGSRAPQCCCGNANDFGCFLPTPRGPRGEGSSKASTPLPQSSPAPQKSEDSDLSFKCSLGNSPISGLQFLESENSNDNTKILSPLSRFIKDVLLIPHQKFLLVRQCLKQPEN